MNNVTLLGLTLVVGVLVDDAIVEIENIVRRMRLEPEVGAYRAALDGSAEIGRAVVATTAAVAFSLVVARLLTPLLGAYLLKPGGTRHHNGDGVGSRCYAALLRYCL